jgi:hypothetical protein
MSTIYLDPAAMDATAGAISGHAYEVGAAIGDLETTCAAEVPPSLAGWLAEELRDIAVHARLAEVLYVVAALDTAFRAQQIQADQSLATAAVAPVATTVAFTETVMGGFSSYGSPVASISDLTGGSLPPAGGFLLGASGPNTPLGGYTPVLGGGSGSGGSGFVFDTYDSFTANLLLPLGLSAVEPGVVEDRTGRQGPITRTYRNPRTGDVEVGP